MFAKAIADTANEINAEVIIFSNTYCGKAVAPRVAVRLEAGFVSGATELPSSDFTIKVNTFSGKAFSNVKINSTNKVISVFG